MTAPPDCGAAALATLLGALDGLPQDGQTAPFALPPPDAIAALAAAELPAVLAQLAALQTAVAARLAAAPAATRPVSDALLDVHAAAALLGHSASWMRKRGRTLPGFVQPTGRGGRARWARAALIAWRDGAC